MNTLKLFLNHAVNNPVNSYNLTYSAKPFPSVAIRLKHQNASVPLDFYTDCAEISEFFVDYLCV